MRFPVATKLATAGEPAWPARASLAGDCAASHRLINETPA